MAGRRLRCKRSLCIAGAPHAGRSGHRAREHDTAREPRNRGWWRRLRLRGPGRELSRRGLEGARGDGQIDRRRSRRDRLRQRGGAMIPILLVLAFTAVIVLLSLSWVV